MALTKVGKEGITGISNSSNATAITIDSSENVGIGVTSMTNKLVLPNAAYFAMQDSGGAESLAIRANSSNAMELLTGGGVKATIDSSGNLLVATTSQILGSTGVSGVQVGASFVSIGKTQTSTGTMMTFNNGNGQVGAITTAGSSTSYSTSSDYRLKTAVEYDWDATSRLKQLKPARFKWIAEGDDAVPVDGFLAHEVQDIVPEAITGTKDAVDEDGNPEYQSIDQSKVVPLLVKTILELEARITALEAS